MEPGTGGTVEALGSIGQYLSGVLPEIALSGTTIAGGTLASGMLPDFGPATDGIFSILPGGVIDAVSTGVIVATTGSSVSALDGTVRPANVTLEDSSSGLTTTLHFLNQYPASSL